MRREEVFALAALMLLAFYARTRYIVGFGLGDDALYAGTSYGFLKEGFKYLSVAYAPTYRLGIYIPVSRSFRILGVNDFAYTLFPLLASTLLVLVVYLIGRELAGPEAGFFAGLIQAVSAFDLTFASTMTIDIPTTFFLSLGILFFLKAEKAEGMKNIVLNFFSAFCTLWAYYIKIPALSIILVYMTLSAFKRKQWRKHLTMYLSLGLLLSAAFTLDYRLAGDPFYRIKGEVVAGPIPNTLENLWREYPRWMFTKDNWLGSYIFGPHFFLTAFAAIFCLAEKKLREKVTPAAAWLAVTFLFLEFAPLSLQLPLKVSFRFFRYAYAFVPPASLISGAALAWLYLHWASRTDKTGKRLPNWRTALFLVLVLLHSTVSISQGLDLAKRYVDHYNDPRYAVRYIASLPPKPVYGDYIFLDRFNFETGYERIGDTRWDVNGVGTNIIVKDKDVSRLRNIKRGYVVFGGARGMDASPEWVLQMGSFKPPKRWRLIYEDDKPLDANRWEPLRVYSIGD